MTSDGPEIAVERGSESSVENGISITNHYYRANEIKCGKGSERFPQRSVTNPLVKMKNQK